MWWVGQIFDGLATKKKTHLVYFHCRLNLLSSSSFSSSTFHHQHRQAIDHCTFTDDLVITNIVSPEKEDVALSNDLDPKGSSVEAWLMSLEEKMRETIRDIMKAALADYLEVKMGEVVFGMVGEVVFGMMGCCWCR